MKIDENEPTIKTATARPFIKWAGGKGQLLRQFAQFYPNGLNDGTISRYVEPFLGGGAVFLDIAQSSQVSEFSLFDINPELILVYRVVKREPQALIERLTRHSDKYYASSESDRKRLFYRIRDAYNAQLPNIDYEVLSEAWIVRAAFMIFLNKTCYNGLYRLNSKGAFNVPFGKYKRPAILDADNILQVSRLLQHADLSVGSFQTCAPHIDNSSFVYFDPPYRPLSATASFTSYSRDKFSDEDQVVLANFFSSIDHNCDASLMLSNSNPKNTNQDDDFFERLYSSFKIHTVYANRMINSNANGRGKISELLITNY